MKIHIDIRDNIPPNIALRYVTWVVEEGRVSAQGKMYAYATTFDTCLGEIWVAARPYRKSDCFLVYKKQRKEARNEKSRRRAENT